MISDLLQPDVQSFILQHEYDDVNTLILKTNDVCGVHIARIADQIEGRKKAREKIPLLHNTKGIVYPPSLNIEQSSSQITAQFKSDILCNRIPIRTICADLTGGLGIDSFFISNVFESVDYVESNTTLYEIARHNHSQLGARNISHHNMTALNYLESLKSPVDCIFIDPSRRDASKRRVYSLSDCEPNAIELLSLILSRSRFLLLKASPLLDVSEAVRQLGKVDHVFIVSVMNDCKEILFLIDRESVSEPAIEAINLGRHDKSTFTFTFSEEKVSKVSYSDPREFIYEPNASVLKSGAFKSISARFNIDKIHPNTHLYTSTALVANFPGRIFRIAGFVKPDPKAVQEYFPEGKANIISRNYPLTPQELKTKTKLSDGGHQFLLGFSGQKKKYLAAALRVS